MTELSSAATHRAPLGMRALRFGRSLIVGSWGTALDFAALSLSIRVLGLEPTWGRVIGLCVGGVVLFYGSRSFAFRAQSGNAAHQAKLFIASELVGFPLNILVFKLLLHLLPHVAPEALGLFANFALFIVYYYPVRSRIVFNAKEPLVVQAAAVHP